MAIKRGEPMNLSGASLVLGVLLLLVGTGLWYLGSSTKAEINRYPPYMMATADARDALATADNLVFWGFVCGVAGAGILLTRVIARNRPTTDSVVDRRACPYCAESIHKNAIKCRYCGSDVEPMVEHDATPEVQPRVQDKPIHQDEQSPGDVIQEMEDALCSAGEPNDPNLVFELGRQYALLYDSTNNPADRQRALEYMLAAVDADSGPFPVIEDTQPFGSLMDDPEFEGFVR